MGEIIVVIVSIVSGRGLGLGHVLGAEGGGPVVRQAVQDGLRLPHLVPVLLEVLRVGHGRHDAV